MKESTINKLEHSLTPKAIVRELDKHIVGQEEAKRAVAIALRNRYRRQAVNESLKHEIVPKNILMVGSTGVGKTEIARRLAQLAQAPFIKVEATKFTEIGYVGRDVESIIRDLIEVAVVNLRRKSHELNSKIAQERAEERIVNALVGENSTDTTKDKFRSMLRDCKLEDKEIEINVKDSGKFPMPSMDIPGMPGGQMGVINIGEMIGKALGGEHKLKPKKLKVSNARKILINEEAESLVEEDKIIAEAVNSVENNGIVFIDELDKISSSHEARGRDVSREGVQRDLLPLIEGTTVSTKYGPVKTDHILFIASGAFHTTKPSDLLPELQGRLPIRVWLKDLTKEDLVRILKEPEASLMKQYVALLATEGVHLDFAEDRIQTIAEVAFAINRDVENIGARRLHTIIEKLLEDVSFNAPDRAGSNVLVDENYVNSNLSDVTTQLDLSKFIL